MKGYHGETYEGDKEDGNIRKKPTFPYTGGSA
jgi:hypothetical protein